MEKSHGWLEALALRLPQMERNFIMKTVRLPEALIALISVGIDTSFNGQH